MFNPGVDKQHTDFTCLFVLLYCIGISQSFVNDFDTRTKAENTLMHYKLIYHVLRDISHELVYVWYALDYQTRPLDPMKHTCYLTLDSRAHSNV